MEPTPTPKRMIQDLKAHGLDGQEIAELIGVGRSTMTKLAKSDSEHGVGGGTLDRLQRVWRRFSRRRAVG